ncbi:GTP-binding protein [Klebsormidium nitens]|uniref:Ras-related protein Rab-21 n=1 Tax=Klebsormidium nitens TaxID=105231 RepID=A0A1Y1IA55_KLENI|nr:GTP-binding protein [Klebsormidium nitens]|eukprot:GAQ87443.1 GTP-binding protein [Klebsormidium nitens]
MRAASPAANLKVVLLGEGRVGKTSLLLRFAKDEFSDTQQATIQASFLSKKVLVDAETSVALSIWDTAGQERFHSLGPIYYRDADAALLVYDVTDKDSFDRVKSWVKELKKMAGRNIVLAIAGNKIDLDRQEELDLTEQTEYAESIGASHFTTSAKLNKGIDAVFQDLAKRALVSKRRAAAAAEAVESTLVPRRQGTLIIDERPKAPPKRSCCS